MLPAPSHLASMGMIGGGTGKRDVLERMRKTSRVRIVGVAFALGCVLGAGVGHVMRSISEPPTGPAPDRTPPAILALDPPEHTFLTAGDATFRITFNEPLTASPSVLLAGPTNFTVAETSFDGLSWRGTVSLSNGSDELYDLRVENVRDRHDNPSPPIAFEFGIDTTQPASRASVTANETTAPFGIAWDASDAGSGITRVELWMRADGGGWTLLSTSPEDRGVYGMDPGDRKGLYELYSLAVDRAGNREKPPPNPDGVVAYDPSPPSASLQGAWSYWFRAPAQLAATATSDVTSAELRYYFAPDNATWQGPFPAGTVTAPFGWTFAFPLGAGHYRLFARGSDETGAREADQTPTAAEVAVGYDVELPTAKLSPLGTYWQRGPVTLFANASDDRSGVAAMDMFFEYRPNGTAAWSGWTLADSRADPPWTFPFVFPRGDGRYELAVRVRDRAGNEGALPPPGQGEVPIGFARDPPPIPDLAVPKFVNASTLKANLTWTVTPSPDLLRFEVHRGTIADFVADREPCPTSTTCVAELGRDARGAWAPLSTANVTYWLRVRAVDDGGLIADSGSVGANVHGLGFDTPNTYAAAAALPTGIAWSERIQYAGGCQDCADVFKVTLDAGNILDLTLAVPSTGDFRLVVYDASIVLIAKSANVGLGTWEALTVEAAASGVYYVVVDWGNVFGPGSRNQGWYTLTALVA